jgi:DnaB-like helicase C terminal domain
LYDSHPVLGTNNLVPAQKKEKLLIENLLSSADVFSRCISIIKPKFFDQPEYRSAITFVSEYFDKYNNLPTFDVVNSEFDLDFKPRQLSLAEYQYTCDEIEKFCKQSAFIHAVTESYDLIENNELDEAYTRMTEALTISLERDMGVELYEDPENYLKRLIETEINHSTGIRTLDEQLNGGFARKTLSLFSANSGVGKSNMLGNLGVNYSLMGFDVVYITLELPEDMIYLRLASMVTTLNINAWKEHISDISTKLLSLRQDGAGSYVVKRLSSCCANDIRSYLKHYETEYKRRPAVIIIDYLDLMRPNGGMKGKGVWEQDKEKTEELTELLVLYDAIGISASQQNREALRMNSPDQGVIAGGISKVNTVHNYISLIMTDEMAIRGEMFAAFLKTRTSSGKGKTVLLSFDANNLRISDSKKDAKSVIANMAQKAKLNRLKNKNSPLIKQVNEKITELKKEKTSEPEQKLMELDGITFDEETGEIVDYQPEAGESKVDNTDDLLNFMQAI